MKRAELDQMRTDDLWSLLQQKVQAHGLALALND